MLCRPRETGVHGGNGPARWLLDPIYGTTNAVHGLPGFVVSIAAQVAGRTVVAPSVTRPPQDLRSLARRHRQAIAG
jgi:myo-inositol-1(or 4)-monophosphatase